MRNPARDSWLPYFLTVNHAEELTTMLRTILSWMGIALVGASYLHAASQEPSSPALPATSPYRAVLNRYCVTCHNEKLRTAELMLDKMEVERTAAFSTR